MIILGKIWQNMSPSNEKISLETKRDKYYDVELATIYEILK